jgi:hypothetical protein
MWSVTTSGNWSLKIDFITIYYRYSKQFFFSKKSIGGVLFFLVSWLLLTSGPNFDQKIFFLWKKKLLKVRNSLVKFCQNKFIPIFHESHKLWQVGAIARMSNDPNNNAEFINQNCGKGFVECIKFISYWDYFLKSYWIKSILWIKSQHKSIVWICLDFETSFWRVWQKAKLTTYAIKNH